MKKILALLLALVLVFSLCACGDTAAKGDKDDTKAPATATPDSPDDESTGGDDEPTGVEDVGYYTDDVDHFAREPYKFVYCYSAASALSDNMIDCYKRLGELYNFELGEMCGNSNAEAYIQGIELEVNKGADGLFVDADPVIHARVYELLNELEIPYVSLFNPMADESGKIVGPSVGIRQNDAGRDAIQWYADRYKDYWGEIDMSKLCMLVLNFSTSPAFQQRADGAYERFAECFPGAATLEADGVTSGKLNSEAGYNLTSQVISAHPEYDYWIVFAVVEDYAQGATRYAETTAHPENILITNSGSNILPLEFESGYDGTSWKVAYAVSDISYAGPSVTGLLAICDGRATEETVWSSWKTEGNDAALYIGEPIMVTKENWSNFKDELWQLYDPSLKK